MTRVVQTPFAQREWHEDQLALVARPGRWSRAAALADLRATTGDPAPAACRWRAELAAWIRHDLVTGACGLSEREVAEVYQRIFAGGRREPMFLSGVSGLRRAGYGRLVDAIPDAVTTRWVGLGCPWTELPRAGERVLDLGAGAGVDVHIASDAVGSAGAVAGLDRRPDLLGFHPPAGTRRVVMRAVAQACPVRDGWATTIVANGLPPLMRPDAMDAVLAEAARVLRPRGRLRAVVLATGRDVPLADVTDGELVNAVRTGKPLCAEYRAAAERAGLSGVRLATLPPPFAPGHDGGSVGAFLLTGCRHG